MWLRTDIEQEEEIVEKIVDSPPFYFNRESIIQALKFGIERTNHIIVKKSDNSYRLMHKSPYKIIQCHFHNPEFGKKCIQGEKCNFIHNDDEEKTAEILKRGAYKYYCEKKIKRMNEKEKMKNQINILKSRNIRYAPQNVMGKKNEIQLLQDEINDFSKKNEKLEFKLEKNVKIFGF